MKIFDAQVRSDTRSDDELRNLHYFETERVLTTAHAPARFERADDLLAYFRRLLTDEVARLERCQLIAHVALGVLPTARPRRSHYEVWRALPDLLAGERVVAVGEIAAWEDTHSHWELFDHQLELAANAGLPVVITPPKSLVVNMTYKMMRHVEASRVSPSRCVINRVTGTVAATAHAEGFVVGLAVGNQDLQPRGGAKLIADLVEEAGTTDRLVLASSLRRGAADVLGIPKTLVALGDRGFPVESIERLAYENAHSLFCG